jgi:uncharacterized membrane protein
MTVDLLAVNAFSPVLILVTAWLLPTLSRPTLPFAVRVPAEHAAAPVIVEQRRAYRWWVGALGGALVLAGLTLSVIYQLYLAGVVLDLLVLVVVASGYLRAKRAIQAVKRREGWYEGLRQAVAADTSLRTEPARFPWLWALPALLLLAVTVVAGIIRYPDMPATLVMHVDAHGVPNRVVPKSVGSAFATVAVQAGVTALIVAVTVLSFRARPDLDPAAPHRAARQYRAFTLRTAKALLVLAACVNLSMLATAWQIWSGGGFSLLAVVLPIVLGAVVLLVVAVRTGQQGSRLPDTDGDEDTGVVQRDDDRYWHGAGNIYVNREDPAVLVPKRLGYGWTVNFGNPRSLLLLLPIVAIGVLARLLAH